MEDICVKIMIIVLLKKIDYIYTFGYRGTVRVVY